MSVEQIKRDIVQAQVRGEDTTKLAKALKDALLEQQVRAEVAELQKIADQRIQYQKRAEAIMARVEKQSEAIDRFLALRDSVTAPLKAIILKAREVDLLKSEETCFSQFHDPFVWDSEARSIPKDYLPSGFSCPSLVMDSAILDSREAGSQALYFLNSAYGLLMNIKKGQMCVSLKPFDDGLGKDEGESGEEVPKRCAVCSHPELTSIDEALQQGRSLRDIEAEFGASRSSLCRHKAHLPAAPGTMSQESQREVETKATVEIAN
jgi:hypothetical protein